MLERKIFLANLFRSVRVEQSQSPDGNTKRLFRLSTFVPWDFALKSDKFHDFTAALITSMGDKSICQMKQHT